MVDVKPDEISAILKQQISGFSNAAELAEFGTVLQVGDGIARVYGLSNAQAGELVEFDETGVQAIVLNLEEDNVGVVLMGSVKELEKVQEYIELVKLLQFLLEKVSLEGLLIHWESPSMEKERYPEKDMKCLLSARLLG
jgi:F-type H+-transporting ATPase subunit alpha